MKIGQYVIPKNLVEILVIPKGGVDIVFKAQPVIDYSGFLAHCPEPKRRTAIKPNGDKIVIDEAEFKEAETKWYNLRFDWMYIESLKPSDIEWDTVDANKPSTWSNWMSDLSNAGFSIFEISKIRGIVDSACGINDAKIEEATKSFLASQEKESNTE